MKERLIPKTTEQQSRIKPSIHNIPGSKWGWVNLCELAGILKISPCDLWQNYFLMSKSRYTLETALEQKDSWLIQERQRKDYPGKAEIKSFLVPAGWSDDVLKAHGLGIVKVIEEKHFHADPFPGEFVDPTDECIAGAINCLRLGSLTIDEKQVELYKKARREHLESDRARGVGTIYEGPADDGMLHCYSAAIGLDADGWRVVFDWHGFRNDQLGGYTSSGMRFKYELVLKKHVVGR